MSTCVILGAMLINAAANALFGGSGGGACYGFALSSQRFIEGEKSLRYFPPGTANTVFRLDGPGTTAPARSPTTSTRCRSRSYRTSSSGITLSRSASTRAWGGAQASHKVFNEIRRILSGRALPADRVARGTSVGTLVVAYNVEGAPPDWSIDVYD